MKKNEYSKLFLLFTVLFVSSILISNIITSKIIYIGGISLTAGILVFPITYIIGDVLTEIYGYKKAQQVIWYGFIANILMISIFFIAIKLPYPDYWVNQEAFSTILGSTPRILCASLMGYLIGSFINAFIMDYIKNNSKIKFLWFRTILSTILGEGVDTIIFITVAFVGTISGVNILSLIISQALAKILYEVLFTPITYNVVKYVRNKEDL